MKHKYKSKNRYKFVVILILILLVSIVLNIVFKNRNISIFEKAIKDSVYVIESLFKTKRESNFDYNEVHNLELEFQIDELKKTLELNKTLNEFEYTNATVLYRDLNTFNSNIVIDKGESSNIKVGMPVMVLEGLIGKVISTSYYTSTVRLLTSNNSNDKISVKFKNENEYLYGLINGYDEVDNTLILEGLSHDTVLLDEIVTTTGMGNMYPSGLVVGKIKKIDTDNFDLANILKVESLVDFNNINYVTIIKGEK